MYRYWDPPNSGSVTNLKRRNSPRVHELSAGTWEKPEGEAGHDEFCVRNFYVLGGAFANSDPSVISTRRHGAGQDGPRGEWRVKTAPEVATGIGKNQVISCFLFDICGIR